jgi:hypothetical protein
MRLKLRLAAVALLAPSVAANAGNIDRQLQMLDPEERAHQVCVIKGVDTMRKDPKLQGVDRKKVDRIKTSITGRAKFTGTQVSTVGGAVRAKDHWYGLKFTCDVTTDQMKALTFTYEVGKEIPEAKWDDLGLWR